MDVNYTVEKHTQILIALLKAHGIKKVIASPGTTNITFVGSIQSDPWFEIFSSVDERSAAYMACGMAAESGEPVVLSCTGSTASRNYVPGLTEAYYRQLPVLAITSAQHLGRVGNMYPQVIDRYEQMKDMVKASVQITPVTSTEDIWDCELKINKAILALSKNGGGPAHINLVTTYSRDFTAKELPIVKKIQHYDSFDKMPSLKTYTRIAILVGAHNRWQDELTEAVEKFCERYNAVVFMNHASNYKGKYGVNHALINGLADFDTQLRKADVVIYVGSVSRYPSGTKNSEMWRVNPDGLAVDPEKILTKVFQMDELRFFQYYVNQGADAKIDSEYAKEWQKLYEETIKKVKELPFSNVWIAQQTISRFPNNSVLHIAGSNTARSWNFFKIPKSVECYSNDGVMGIDGQVSSLIGESLISKDRLHFGTVGDLTFFYDMNSIGNHFVGNNLRLMVVNNGVGAEFKIYSHPAASFGEEGNAFMAAKGHFGNKSPNLLRHFAEDLGFEYLTASTKEEYLNVVERFITPEITDKPMLFEVFTDSKNESDAIYHMNHLIKNVQSSAKSVAKDVIKKVAGEKGIKTVKKMLRKN